MPADNDITSSLSPDDRPDFAVLWAESCDRLRVYVRIFVPSVHDAEDVLQETAIAIARDFEKYDAKRPFLDWAVGVARNRVLQFYRTRKRDRRMIFNIDAVKSIEASLLDYGQRTELFESSLEFCVEQLPVRSNRMLRLRYADDLKAGDIARELGMTVKSVYARLSQIRAGLRECVQRRLRLIGEVES